MPKEENVIFKERKNDEIIKILKDNYDLLQIEIKDISEIFFKMMLENYFSDVDINTLDFVVYKIKRNRKSKKLYKYLIKRQLLHRQDFIFIIFENTTNLFDTNCSVMLDKLIILKGASEEDYKNNSIKYQHYIATLNDIEEHRFII